MDNPSLEPTHTIAQARFSRTRPNATTCSPPHDFSPEVKAALQQACAILPTLFSELNPCCPHHGLCEQPWQSKIRVWFRSFHRDILASNFGYPKNKVREQPDLEDELIEIATRSGAALDPRPPTSEATLCLSHDVEYLTPPSPLLLKRFLRVRSISLFKIRENYLSALEGLLETERDLLGPEVRSSVFVACPQTSPSYLRQAIQWLIDPAYGVEDNATQDLLELLQKYRCEVGIHGSLYSLVEGSLALEKDRLGRTIAQPIRSGRQHCLHLPGRQALLRIYQAGIRIDSTLGWNGRVGFRGGMARAFPIALGGRRQLWEVPLVLVDRTLHHQMKLDSSRILEKSMEILERVYERRGCVAVGWQGELAHQPQGAPNTYPSLLKWAKERGFSFRTLSQTVPQGLETLSKNSMHHVSEHRSEKETKQNRP